MSIVTVLKAAQSLFARTGADAWFIPEVFPGNESVWRLTEALERARTGPVDRGASRFSGVQPSATTRVSTLVDAVILLHGVRDWGVKGAECANLLDDVSGAVGQEKIALLDGMQRLTRADRAALTRRLSPVSVRVAQLVAELARWFQQHGKENLFDLEEDSVFAALRVTTVDFDCIVQSNVFIETPKDGLARDKVLLIGGVE